MESSYTGKTVLVVGAARSGIASAGFLLSRGARVVLTDTRPPAELEESVRGLREGTAGTGEIVFEFGGHRPESFRSCDLVVVSPGVPLALPMFQESRRAGVPVIAEVELAFRHLRGTILAVTGSNGKTTTTTLLAEMLRGAGLAARAAGNIGQALIGFVDNSTPGDMLCVELSSFQLEGIHRFRPRAGAILNISPDHMDRYPSFEAYAGAKKRIFENQQADDFAVLNADDPNAAAIAREVRSTPVLFSRRTEVERGAFVRDGKLVFRTGGLEHEIAEIDDLRLKGAHNLENTLAACALAMIAGAPAGSLAPVIRSFRGVEHRLEWVAELDGVDYYNDSKATNVDAAIKSLEAFPGGILLIAGGRDKAGNFEALREHVRSRVKLAVLIGEAAGKISDALEGSAPIATARTLPDAVEVCRRSAAAGDVVLLAPACASFDMFENYEHRGRVFKEAVRSLER